MIVTLPELKSLRLDDITVGITSGCFDLLHYYHLQYLERCRRECDFLIVGVDSDLLVYGFKKKIPVISEDQRVAMVGALRCVDATFIMTSVKTFEQACEFAQKVFKHSPTLYDKEIAGGEGKLVVIPDIEQLASTTKIVEFIRKNVA